MRSWFLSPVAAALAAAISTGFLFCPCGAEAPEHEGCSDATTRLREVRCDCCSEAVRSEALTTSPTYLPPSPPFAAAEPAVLVPGDDVHTGTPPLGSLRARSLVMRI
jgi:hypothetical protein